jgi:DNA polymerase-3 subunit delta'
MTHHSNMGFESFLGNPKAVSAVRAMLASGRMPGALLFAGPEGVGKKTLALMLAKALNCERRGENGDNFCGECGRCRKAEEMLSASRDDLARRRETKDAKKRVEGLVYFDLQLIEPLTRYILLEQVRQMRSVAYTCPFEFPHRVLVLDQVQTVHWQATDLLLKVLEEPPETTTFILVCPNPYELRPTIRSRCLQVPFLSAEEPVIGKLLDEEKRVNKEQRALALRVSAGSVVKAKSFDPADFDRHRKPWLDYLESVAGKGSGPKAEPDWKALFDSTRTLAENRADFEATLRMGYTLLRDLLLLLEAGGTGAAAPARLDREVINVDIIARLRIWAVKLGFLGLDKLKAGLDQAHRLQTRNVNQQMGLDALASDLLAGP